VAPTFSELLLGALLYFPPEALAEPHWPFETTGPSKDAPVPFEQAVAEEVPAKAGTAITAISAAITNMATNTTSFLLTIPKIFPSLL
jgi:hypothetical protein